MRKLLFFGMAPVMVMLGACNPAGILSGSDATQNAYATARVETVVFASTQAGTVVALQSTADSAAAMETQLAQLQLQNQSLQGTLDAVETTGVMILPTPTLAPVAPTQGLPVLAQNYSDIRTTLVIDAAGCGGNKQGRFATNDSRIYLTMVGTDIQPNQAHQVRWYLGQQLRYDSAPWIPEQSYAQTCIYFWIDPSITPFDVGIWRAELLVDNQIVLDVPFEICTAGELC